MVFDAEVTLLRAKGVSVSTFCKANKNIDRINQLSAAFNLTYCKKARNDLYALLQRKKPDIVHIHNFFPLISPSVYDACIDCGVPVVQTLHNYRLICPGAFLMRDGKVCEDCIVGSPYNAVRYGCYRGSRIATYPVSRMVDHHRRKKTWATKVNRFIALTNFARDKFIQAGFQSDKIMVKPNFISQRHDSCCRSHDEICNINIEDNISALFVGRLSDEKGILTLAKAWVSLDVQLKVIGSGPLRHKLSLNGTKISCLGNLNRDLVIQEMKSSSFLVMPSEWYEGFPMVLVEAFSCGLPVIASRMGGMVEIVENGITGLHFEPGNSDDLVGKVRWMIEHPKGRQKMALNARRIYEERYTAEKNYQMLIEIYQQATYDACSHC